MRRAAEFFAGIGLVRLALERAGWRVVFANDIDEQKSLIYKANFAASEFRLGDIHVLRPKEVPDVELATASFPCIDLSLAGNRNGLNGAHSSAYWGFHRLISGMGRRRPRAVLLENVVGLLTSNAGRDLRDIIRSLNRLGYTCDLLQVDAVFFVPQSRPRLFVIGWRDLPRCHYTLVPDHPARPAPVREFTAENGDLSWFHFPLPPFPGRQHQLGELLDDVPDDSTQWWNEERQRHLYSQISPRETLIKFSAFHSQAS